MSVPKLHKSVQDHKKVCKITKTQFFIPIILFLVKKGYYGNESLGLAWDHIRVFQIAPSITTQGTALICIRPTNDSRLKWIFQDKQLDTCLRLYRSVFKFLLT